MRNGHELGPRARTIHANALRACLEKGSNLTEMTEALHVAASIRGGATLVHGVQMRNVAEKLSL